MSIFLFCLATALGAPNGAAHLGAGAEVRLDSQAEPLMPAVQAAADEFDVPEALLAALVWEASRFDPRATSQWSGYGPLDLREDRDPSIEGAAILLGLSPDELIADPAHNVRGGAALLARQARRANGGQLPDVDDLESWWSAVRAFSGDHDPNFQETYATFVFELVRDGVNGVSPTGERVRFGRIPVDIESLTERDEGVMMMPATTDYAGAYQYIQACNYTNQSRTPSSINQVVIHTVQGSYSGCISWFQNCSSEVSAHYVVRSSDGQITQMVREEDKAWHAGNSNSYSIGIEHEGYVDDPGTWYTEAMYKASAALTADIVARTGATADRSSIIAHSEAPGATHTDPGSGWDWDYYMSLVTGSYTVAGTMKGVVAVEDIYEGERLVGVPVTLLETGETTTTDSTGYYTFSDLPSGTYTVQANAAGYTNETCSKTVSDSSTYWCSIAVLPAEDPPEDTGTPPDTDTPDDTGAPPTQDEVPGAGGPGARHLQSEAGGCDTTGGAASLLALGIALLGLRRRSKA